VLFSHLFLDKFLPTGLPWGLTMTWALGQTLIFSGWLTARKTAFSQFPPALAEITRLLAAPAQGAGRESFDFAGRSC
jgi:predicted ester cyclase